VGLQVIGLGMGHFVSKRVGPKVGGRIGVFVDKRVNFLVGAKVGFGIAALGRLEGVLVGSGDDVLHATIKT
jgi:hypothetical protein